MTTVRGDSERIKFNFENNSSKTQQPFVISFYICIENHVNVSVLVCMGIQMFACNFFVIAIANAIDKLLCNFYSLSFIDGAGWPLCMRYGAWMVEWWRFAFAIFDIPPPPRHGSTRAVKGPGECKNLLRRCKSPVDSSR